MVDWLAEVARDDPSLTRIADLRERFQRQPEASGWLAAPHRAWRFLALAVKKARDDDLNQQSAALAFITLFSLIPLLSAFSVFGAKAFEKENVQQRMLELLGRIFPYSEEILFDNLKGFLDNAQTLSGFGSLVFLVTALMAFSSIEQTINRVWNVPHRRPFRVRLLSFTLLIFWGPVVIGATFSSLFFLRNVEVFDRFTRSLPARLLPFAVTLVGLTMLYWLVPYTKVRFRSAFAGGLAATFLLEGLRQGFGLYVEQVRTVWIVYKSIGFVFIFMVAVQLSWWIVLLGTEVAYWMQNYPVLLQERRRASAPEGSWLGVVALVYLTERFKRRDPITPHEVLADRLNLPAADLTGVMAPLVAGGLVRETTGEEEGFLLACDPYEVRLTEVLELYEEEHWKVLSALPEEVALRLQKLRVRFTESRDRQARNVVLAELAAEGEKAE